MTAVGFGEPPRIAVQGLGKTFQLGAGRIEAVRDVTFNV
jgi:hypothetical protein